MHSLAGEPTRVRLDIADPVVSGADAQKQSDGNWALTLAKGKTVIFHAPGSTPTERTIAPVDGANAGSDEHNSFGLP